MKKCIVLFLASLVLNANARQLDGDAIPATKGDLIVHPVQHASLVLKWNDVIVYVDPNGGAGYYKDLPAPTIILITDIHGDHMNPSTLDAIDYSNATFVVPGAVEEKLDDKYKTNMKVLGNGESTYLDNIRIEAIPMYNLPQDEESRHTKGRGNGYVLTFGGKRVYISGDTEDIPEMRALQNIEVAFICMNLPYTMSVEQAADAVLDFKPKIVYPYHYRGNGGLSDVDKFKALVNEGKPDIDVRLRDWYKPQN